MAAGTHAQRTEHRHDQLMPVENLMPYFQQASAEFQVPVEILMGVAYIESRWRQRIPDESDHHMPPSFGVMGLRNDAHFGHSLEKAASLIHQPVSGLKTNAFQNIRGAAAYLQFISQNINTNGQTMTDPDSWEPVLEKYSGIQQADIAPVYGDEVYDILVKGCQQGHIQIPATPVHHVPLNRSAAEHRSEQPSTPDYPSALWVAASTSNYTSSSRTGTYPINLIIMHDMEGTYASAISWFQDPSAAACAHYLIRSSDGQVTQMVQEKDVAWHCGNWDYNTRSIGIEQEGYYNDPTYYTSTLYSSAASLCQYLCNKYAIPKTRQYIIGHDQVPDPSDSTLWGGANQHQDPGGFYKWRTLIEEVSGIASTFTPVKVTAGSLNVRCEPRATSPILTTLAANQEFVQYGTATNGWALIFITGKNSEHYDGWCSNSYLTADNCAPQIETQNSWPATLSVYTNAVSSTSNVDAITDGQRFVATGTATTGYDGNTAWRNFYTPASATAANGWISGANLNFIQGGNITPLLSISASNTSICPNQSVTITASPTNGGNSPTYQWYVGGVASGTGATLTLSNISANTGVYCVLTSNAACVTTTTAQSNQVNITVTNTVSAPVISPANPGGCGSVQVSASSAGCNTCTYQWSTPAGNASGSAITASSTGSYSVTANNNGCSATAGTSVTISSDPNVSVSIPNNNICSGTSAIISLSGNATGYVWSNGLGTSSTINVSPVTTTTYTVTATSGNCTATGSATINVIQTPVISVNPVSTSICTGGNGTSLTVYGNATSFNWSDGLGTTATVTANPSSTTVYTVTASNGNCSATSSATVNVNSAPTASISPDNVSICAGYSAVISAYPNGNAYAWSGPAFYSGTGQTANITATGTYTVTITNPGGCAGSATASLQVTAGISPTVTTVGNINIQSGQQVQLGVTATGGISPYNYSWSPANGLSNNSISSPVTSPTVTTIYTVTVTGANGCTATGQVTVDIQDTLCASINVVIAINGDQLAANYIANATYQWQLNGHNIADSTSRFITATAQGQYGVVVTIGRCTYYSNNQLFTSVTDLSIRQLSIYPNPSGGEFILSFETMQAEDISLRIFDAMGQLIKEEALGKLTGTFTQKINLEHTAKGVYLLQIEADGYTLTKKLF